MENIAWMAWTPQPACFFAVIALVLLAMIAGSPAARPETARGRASCGSPTTRGDRLFLSLVLGCRSSTSPGSGWSPSRRSPSGSAGESIVGCWLATVISLVAAVFVFRTV